MLSERERMIGARLRDFRESLQIPRTRFAVSLGFGGERIASYESGRAALPYEVFRAVFTKYSINASWLATGEGSSKNDGPPYLGFLPGDVKRGTTFSQVYDERLAAFIAKLEREEEMEADEVLGYIRGFLEGTKGRSAEKNDPVILAPLKALAASIKRKHPELAQHSKLKKNKK